MKRQELPIVFVFFVSGFADATGAMVGFARESFHLADATAGLLPVCGFMAFGLFALPGGLLAARRGSRVATLLGLWLVLAGDLAPGILHPGFPGLLGALVLIGVGMTLLQVGGHALLREVADPGAFPRTLTFAQFIKGVGSMGGPLLLALLASRGLPWMGAFRAFALGTGAALLWLILAPTPVHVPPQDAPGPRESLALLKDPVVGACVLGVALYTGAEVGLSSWLASHLASTFGLDLGTTATRWGPTLFFGALCAGRLLGSQALRVASPRAFLRVCALGGLAGVLGLLAPARGVVLASVALCGLCFGNIWPLVFSQALERRPGRSREMSGLLCTAIAGGALLPPLMGAVGDALAIRWSFLVPAGSFVYLSGLALVLGRLPGPRTGPA